MQWATQYRHNDDYDIFIYSRFLAQLVSYEVPLIRCIAALYAHVLYHVEAGVLPIPEMVFYVWVLVSRTSPAWRYTSFNLKGVMGAQRGMSRMPHLL